MRGGEKIYQAAGEAVFEAHPVIRGGVAFGVPHPELGAVVAAVADADIDEREFAWVGRGGTRSGTTAVTLTLVHEAAQRRGQDIPSGLA